MCFKICIWTSTHSETHKKWINTEMILGFISINGNYETKNCECHQHKKTQIQNRDRDTHIETPLSYGPSAPCAEYSGGRNSCQAANQPNTRGKTKKQTSQTQGAKPKSKPDKHRAQNQSNQKPKLQESANRKSDYAHIEPKPRHQKNWGDMFWTKKVGFVFIIQLFIYVFFLLSTFNI